MDVKVTFEVLGKKLTRAEAEELHRSLGSALGKDAVMPPFFPSQESWWDTPTAPTLVYSDTTA